LPLRDPTHPFEYDSAEVRRSEGPPAHRIADPRTAHLPDEVGSDVGRAALVLGLRAPPDEEFLAVEFDHAGRAIVPFRIPEDSGTPTDITERDLG